MLSSENCEVDSESESSRVQGVQGVQGDADAPSFETLCLPFVDEMRSYARSLTKEGAWADDLVQDALVRAWQGWSRFTPDPSLGTPRDAVRAWLYKIVTHTFRNQVESRDRIAKYDTVYVDRGEGGAVSDDNRDHRSYKVARRGLQTAHVTDVLMGGAGIGDEVLLAIARLTPEHREVVELHYLEGLTLTQIAEHLGMPRKTAGTRLHRARPMLKAALRAYAKEEYRIEMKVRRRGRRPAPVSP